MAGELGTISGQVRLDVRQAVASYVALRAANARTLYALRGASAAFIAFGKVTGAVGLALGYVFYKAVKSAANFEKQLDFFGAVSNSTAAEMELVRAKALELGRDTIFSAGQIADGFIELGKAGITAKQLVEGVGEAVATLGAAADIPLASAGQIITAAVQTFALEAQDAVHVADLLAGAANASIVEVEDLGVSLKYVGGVAHAISIPIEDVIDAISLLGKAGIRGSTAGTSLRQIIVSLTGTSKKAEEELKALGIITDDGSNKFFTAEGKAKSLSRIFQILQDHTKNLSEEQRLAAFKTIFQNRALAAASILTRQGAKGFKTMNAEISKTTALDVAHKRLDNLAGDIEILKGNIETLFIEAGTPFQEFLRSVVQLLTKMVQAFSKLSPETQKLVFQIIAFSAAGLLVMSVVSTTIGIILRFWRAVKLMGAALSLLFKIMRIGIVVFRLLGIAMVSNPIGLIVLAIIALIAVFVILYKKSETFRRGLAVIGHALVAAWNAVVAFFKALPAFFAGVWNAIVSGVTSAWNGVATFFTSTLPGWFKAGLNAIKNFFVSIWNGIVSFFQAIPGAILSVAKKLIDGIVTFFAALPRRVGFIIGFAIGFWIRLWLNFAKMMANLIIRIVTSTVNFFRQLPGRVAAFFTALWHGIISILTSLWHGAVNIVKQTVTAVLNFFRQLPGRVAAFFRNMWTRAVNLLNQLWHGAVNLAKQIVTGIINFFRQLPSRTATFFRNMWQRAVNLLRNLWTSAKDFAGKILGSIREKLNELPGVVADIFGRVLQAFKDVVGRAFQAAKDFAGGLWDGFKSGLGIGSPSYIERAAWQITGVLKTEADRMPKLVSKFQKAGRDLAKVPTVDERTMSSMARRAAMDLDAAQRMNAKLRAQRADEAARSLAPINRMARREARGLVAANSITNNRGGDTFNIYSPQKKRVEESYEASLNRKKHSKGWGQ